MTLHKSKATGNFSFLYPDSIPRAGMFSQTGVGANIPVEIIDATLEGADKNNHMLSLSGASEIPLMAVRIVNMSGHDVCHAGVSGNTHQIKLAHLPAGIYLLQAFYHGKHRTLKFHIGR